MLWFEGRGIDYERIAHYDLARVIGGCGMPPWARFRGETWHCTGHKLIARAYNAHGICCSLHARVVDLGHHRKGPKAVWPTGASSSGLVMACPRGQQLLAGADLTGWTERVLIVAEGAPDFWSWSSQWRDDATSPATIGITAGSWTEDIAERVPRDVRVIIAVHEDAAGDKYAARIAETLRGHDVRRKSYATAQLPSEEDNDGCK
ncbi:MAG: hypothetical protein H6707_11010 [Deltaproteobacteria bacterium]|nr:hypothetical protein [Deltaproteobacteria bacterium]